VWTGKGHRPRKMTAGNNLAVALTEYRSRWTKSTGCEPGTTEHIVCNLATRGNWKSTIHLSVRWGVPASRDSVYGAITRRAQGAGLGHVAPHDLRRSAAGILHAARTSDGGHRFDLLDIQRVLGHADPATTMRSYLEPLDYGLFGRVAETLD
jgi:integrase